MSNHRHRLCNLLYSYHEETDLKMVNHSARTPLRLMDVKLPCPLFRTESDVLIRAGEMQERPPQNLHRWQAAHFVLHPLLHLFGLGPDLSGARGKNPKSCHRTIPNLNLAGSFAKG